MKNIVEEIQRNVETYLSRYNIKSLIIGVSGGLDSGLNCALLKPICDKLGIPLIGRYIHIETNKEEEMIRANQIGKIFCHDYKAIDLTSLYMDTKTIMEEERPHDDNDKVVRIRRGNIKARLRMTYLYNLASEYGGIVVDNDNQTEHLLGFWTLNGDIGDITPLFDLYKTEVYDLARYYLTTLVSDDEKNALQGVIDAVPTDGLGITSSDVEQFGVNSYNEVDEILQSYLNGYTYNRNVQRKLEQKYNKETINKVIQRHLNSDFKRHHPYRINLMLERKKWWNKKKD